MKQLWYYFVALSSGACVMMLEMIGFRMFAPHFGYSIYVTGSMISAILLSMSMGYIFGGWLADRSKTETPLFLALLFGGIFLVAVILGYHPLLHYLQPKGLILGTLFGSFLLFTVPMILLSIPSPYLIKLMVNRDIGTTTGKIVATSTMGSILGTLFASFYLLPAHGVHFALVFTATLVLIISIIGLASRHKASFLLLVTLPGLAQLPKMSPPFPSNQFQVLWDMESAYSRLLVVKDKYRNVVSVMPTYQFVQSERAVKKKLSLTKSELDYYSLGGLLHGSPKKLLLLGLGAGTTFQQLRYFFHKAFIVGVDIDPQMIEIGKRFFGLQQDKRSKFVVQDARRYLQSTRKKFDVVAINLTAGSIFIPFYMATLEAFQQIERRMTQHGWMLMNIVDTSPTKFLARCIMNTAHKVWPNVYSIQIEGNVVMLASQTSFSESSIQKSMKPFKMKMLKPMVKNSLRLLKHWDRKKPRGCRVWTDNHSALEAMTFKTLQALHNEPF